MRKHIVKVICTILITIISFAIDYGNTFFTNVKISSNILLVCKGTEVNDYEYCVLPDLDFLNSASSSFNLYASSKLEKPTKASLKLLGPGFEVKAITPRDGQGSFRVSFEKMKLPSGRMELSAICEDQAGKKIGQSTFIVRRNKGSLNLVSWDPGCLWCKKILVEPVLLDMGYLKLKDGTGTFVKFTNTSSESVFFTVTSSQPWAVFPLGNQVSLGAGQSTQIKVGVDWRYAGPGQFAQTRLTLFGKGIRLVFPACASILPDLPECITAQATQIDFGFVKRKDTVERTLTLSAKPQTGVEIASIDGWAVASPSSLTVGQSVKVKLSVKGGRLPFGESHRTSLGIMPKSACQLVFIPVTVQTEKDMTVILAVGSKKATINGEGVAIEVPPKILYGGSTFVPVRFISETFGCDVAYDIPTKKITITRGEKTIELWVGQTSAKIDKADATLASPPVVEASRTLVPLRFISEAFKAKVDWEPAAKKITIFWEPL